MVEVAEDLAGRLRGEFAGDCGAVWWRGFVGRRRGREVWVHCLINTAETKLRGDGGLEPLPQLVCQQEAGLLLLLGAASHVRGCRVFLSMLVLV